MSAQPISLSTHLFKPSSTSFRIVVFLLGIRLFYAYFVIIVLLFWGSFFILLLTLLLTISRSFSLFYFLVFIRIRQYSGCLLSWKCSLIITIVYMGDLLIQIVLRSTILFNNCFRTYLSYASWLFPNFQDRMLVSKSSYRENAKIFV